MSWYLVKASCQAASFSGGIAPTIGSHCVIERPEPVSRVSPPTASIATISAATKSSQIPTARWLG